METIVLWQKWYEKLTQWIGSIASMLFVTFSSSNDIFVNFYNHYMNAWKLEEAFIVCRKAIAKSNKHCFEKSEIEKWIDRYYDIREKVFFHYLNQGKFYEALKLCNLSIEYEAEIWNA